MPSFAFPPKYNGGSNILKISLERLRKFIKNNLKESSK